MKNVALVSTLIVCLLTSLCAADVVVTVTPQGDGTNGMERAGYGYPWEWVGFDAGASPESAYHWYDSPNGGWRDVYVQIGLDTLPNNAGDIVSASLFVNVEGYGGNNAYLNHASNSSAANGNASQQIGADQFVANLSPAGLGWMSIDVTDFIKADVTNNYSWAAFTFVHNGYSSFTFSSGESACAPYLLVVPEPTTVALLGLGALSLLRRKR